MKPNVMTAAELQRRLILVLQTRQPALYVLSKYTGIDRNDLRRYAKGTFAPAAPRRLVLTSFFRKIDLGLLEFYQRPARHQDGGIIWDVRPAANPRPPTQGCVTLGPGGPKLRFKTIRELMGYEEWQPRESADVLSSSLNESSKNIVV